MFDNLISGVSGLFSFGSDFGDVNTPGPGQVYTGGTEYNGTFYPTTEPADTSHYSFGDKALIGLILVLAIAIIVVEKI